jgi:hypothetical protein
VVFAWRGVNLIELNVSHCGVDLDLGSGDMNSSDCTVTTN